MGAFHRVLVYGVEGFKDFLLDLESCSLGIFGDGNFKIQGI